MSLPLCKYGCRPIEFKPIQEKKKIVFVDIDNTIAITEKLDYVSARPLQDRIDVINRYYDEGYQVVYWTARGSVSKIDYRELTETQLNMWGCKYHELRMDKPNADLFIDDKSIEANLFFHQDLNK